MIIPKHINREKLKTIKKCTNMKRFLIVSFFLIIIACNKTMPSPRIKIHLSGKNIKQGHTIAIFLTSYTPLKKVTAYIPGKRIQFFNLYKNRIFRLFYGVDVAMRPGNINVLIKILTPDNKILFKRVNFNIIPHIFKQRTTDGRKFKPVIRYTKRMLDILKKRREIIRDNRYILRKYRTVSPFQYWTLNFIKPTKWLRYAWAKRKGKIIKIALEKPVFGMKRVNITKRGIRVRYHRGTDYSNVKGTPVLAVGPGKIITTRHLTAHGNTVIIDHGQGILSVYCHLSKILVKPGQFVPRAFKIAEVGTTGLSTGNHLHFEVRVNGVSVTPTEWFKYNFYFPLFY